MWLKFQNFEFTGIYDLSERNSKGEESGDWRWCFVRWLLSNDVWHMVRDKRQCNDMANRGMPNLAALSLLTN